MGGRAPVGFIEARTGEILNRFTQDVGIVDLELPMAFLNTIFALAGILGSVAVLAISSPYTLVSLAASACILCYVGKRYTATSSQLRTLQIAAQAPVVESLRAGFEGRCTIRAFGLQNTLGRTLVDRVHQAQKSAYLFRSLQSWLMLTLDLISAGIAVTLAALLVGLKSQAHVGWAGVALVNTISLAQDLKLMLHWISTLEVSMGVIQRIREFITGTPSEDNNRLSLDPPSEEWPRSGQVRFENVSCSYG